MKFALVMIETGRSREHIRSDRADHRAKIEMWMAAVAAKGQLVGGEAFETERVKPATLRLSESGHRSRQELAHGRDH